MFVPRRSPFSQQAARAAIARSFSWADALRLLGYEPKGHNYRTLQRWAKRWAISTEHFDPGVGRRRENKRRERPLDEVMVENSDYHRGKLKMRLINAGIKQAICEICGQGEIWKGRRMSLVLDHINGVSNDHRLENLRIVCPNCAATLETHCGRKLPRQKTCPSCQGSFEPRHVRHRYCSERCWGAAASEIKRGIPHPETRKVPRPTYEQLLEDIETMSFVAIGRKYGVSDNAVRKWVRWYEAARDREVQPTRGEEVPPADPEAEAA